jgi:hypothetical protein
MFAKKFLVSMIIIVLAAGGAIAIGRSPAKPGLNNISELGLIGPA